MIRTPASMLRLSLIALGIAALGGCPNLSLVPPAEGVLEGAWVLTETEVSNLEDMRIEIDERGQLTRVTYRITDDARLEDDRPDGRTEVDGDEVYLETSFGLNTLEFNGEFDDNQLVITGTLKTKYGIGGLNLVAEEGRAVFERE